MPRVEGISRKVGLARSLSSATRPDRWAGRCTVWRACRGAVLGIALISALVNVLYLTGSCGYSRQEAAPSPGKAKRPAVDASSKDTAACRQARILGNP
jgi:hypothetical protein